MPKRLSSHYTAPRGEIQQQGNYLVYFYLSVNAR